MVKNPPANAGDTRDVGSISESGRSPGVGNSNLLQYSCLENSMNRGAWWATIHGIAKSWTWLSDWGLSTINHSVEKSWLVRAYQVKSAPGNILDQSNTPLTRASLLAQTVKRLPAMWEIGVRSLGHEDNLEKEMATHCSTLAWNIPWMEEPRRL